MYSFCKFDKLFAITNIHRHCNYDGHPDISFACSGHTGSEFSSLLAVKPAALCVKGEHSVVCRPLTVHHGLVLL